MTSRPRTVHVCSECGHRSAKWLGRCPDCGAWSSLVEQVEAARGRGVAGRPVAPAASRATALRDVSGTEAERVPTGLSELDRCLGGGLVPGSLILVGGEPGIGKSTLLLQAARCLAETGRCALLVSGEESPAQVRLRAERLGLSGDGVFVMGETDLETVVAEANRLAPDLLVVDSVQVMQDAALDSAPGTVSQVRRVAERLLGLAKATGTATVLIGHVTKDGSLAGPRTLEHLVDAVLAFESEAGDVHRLLRTAKNRFGPTGEVGVFEMRGDGLVEVPDASRLFLAERRPDTPGSVVFPAMEGTRPVLVEVQALVATTAFPQPKRMAVGADLNRLTMLLAVLGRRADQLLGDQDVFVNVAGGLRLRETAADLAVAAAVVSAFRGLSVAGDVALFGEVGLSGEIRSVDRPVPRLKEVAALGLTRCVVPRGNVPPARERPEGVEVVGVGDVAGACRLLFGGRD